MFLLPSAGFVIPLQFTVIITDTVLELIYSYMLHVTGYPDVSTAMPSFVARIATAAEPPATQLAGLFAVDERVHTSKILRRR